MADAATMDVRAANAGIRLWGALLCAICGLTLIPALALAWYGLLWLPGLDGFDWLSAAFLVAGPLLLGLAAACGWRAALRRDRRSLLRGAFFTLLALMVYAVPGNWGGRLLL